MVLNKCSSREYRSVLLRKEKVFEVIFPKDEKEFLNAIPEEGSECDQVTFQSRYTRRN